MTHIEIVKKLIGEISPAGATHIDEVRFKNLKEMCRLAELIILEIDDVSYRNKDRQEHSMKEMGEYAHRFLTKELGIPE